MGFGRLPIFVRIWQGGSVASDTLNYRKPLAKRGRSKAETGTGILEISDSSGGSRPLVFGRLPIGAGVSQVGSVSSDTSNYMMPVE